MPEPIVDTPAGLAEALSAPSGPDLGTLLKRTFTPRVIEWRGGFAGLFQLDANIGLLSRTYRDPILVTTTHGAGPKIKLARAADRDAALALDLVAASVNDCLCAGAEPLFFLNHLSVGRDDPALSRDVLQGISDGCVEAECALIGTESTIVPELYDAGEYDLTGFCVGVVERKHILTGDEIRTGDKLIGLASSGLRSNEYRLACQAALEEAGLTPDHHVLELDKSIADAFLEPGRIYVRALKSVYRHYRVKRVVHGIANVAGGGLADIARRVLPEGCAVEVRRESWPIPPLYAWIQGLSKRSDAAMCEHFGMGIGLILFVADYHADAVTRYLSRQGRVPAWVIGEVVSGDRTVTWS